MSKENLQKLNESLIKHLQLTNVRNAFYYEPLYDYYWTQKYKIGICNLEPYDNGLGKNLQGIKKVDDKVIVDYWYNSQTIQRTLKMFQLITKELNEGFVSDKDITECNNRNVDKVVEEDLGCSLYFNFRLTVGEHVDENKTQILNFYKDQFYIDYYKDFLKETELNMLIITGETGCNLINQIFPEAKLKFNSEPVKIGSLVLCSSPHPASRNFSNKEMAENMNKYFDFYWKTQNL